MHSPAPSPLPDYEFPPVIEVVIGAQFAPISRFLPTHPGLFWCLVRDEYPRVESAPVLAQMHEQFGSTMATEPAEVSLLAVPPIPRVFFIDESDCWLIQLQSDRLLQNWRKGASSESYPRFPAVLARFNSSWSTFQKFCEQEELELPVVNQLEVTYINHIPFGEGWNSFAEIGSVFADFNWRSGDRFLPAPEAVAWRMSFVMPDELGRLHVSVRPAIRKTDGARIQFCEITARGKPQEPTHECVSLWLELAREWIVRGFADLTSKAIQERHWGRKS